MPPDISSWSKKDTFFALIVIMGFICAVILPSRINTQPFVIAIILGTTVAAFAYLLGGVIEATLNIGWLRLGGAVAVLVGVTLLANQHLEKSMQFRLSNADDLVGNWRWVYGEAGWSGNLAFKKDNNGKIVFEGTEFQYVPGQPRSKIYDLKKGTAILTEGNKLKLEATVTDYSHDGTELHWESIGSLHPTPAFEGNLESKQINTQQPGVPYGMMLYKTDE